MRHARAFSETANLPIANYPAQPWPPPTDLAGDAIRDFVVTNGRDHGVEFLVAINGAGQIVESIRGTRQSTGATEKLRKAMRDSSSQLNVHHNHPSGGPLSDADLTHLVLPGVSAIFAHALTAGRVFTSRAKLTTRGRSVLDLEIEHFGIDRSLYSFYIVLMSPFAFDKTIQRQVWRGRIDCSEANFCRRMALFEALNRTGLFLIENDFPPPPLFERADIQDGIDRLAGEIARAYGTEQ